MCISFFFLDRFLSLCDLGWSGTFVDQAGHRLRYPLPQVLGLKACATVASILHISLETYSLFSDFVQLRECRTLANTVYWSADDNHFSCSWLGLGASVLHSDESLQLTLHARTYFKVPLLKEGEFAFTLRLLPAAVPQLVRVAVHSTVLGSPTQPFSCLLPRQCFV